MQVKPFIPEQHYLTVASWWEGHNWPVIPLQALPKTGLIIETSKPVCAGWLYRTDSSICWMEWIVCNPKAEKPGRSEAIDLLILELIKIAQEMGFTTIFSSVRNKSFLARLERQGFAVSDNNMTNVIRVV